MKERILLLWAFLMALSVPAAAFEKPYTLELSGVYGYNTTWGNYGGAALRGEIPLNEHFEMTANMELLSANVHTFSANFQPKFALPVGEIFLDGGLLATVYQRNRMDEIVMAASLGYRMDYVSFQIGFYGRIIDDMDVEWHNESNYVSEFFNLLYRLQVNVRPYTSPWNLYFVFSNVTELQYERMWQPLFAVGFHYDFKGPLAAKRHWRILADILCKPTGMFHLDASFYGIKTRVGVAYVF